MSPTSYRTAPPRGERPSATIRPRPPRQPGPATDASDAIHKIVHSYGNYFLATMGLEPPHGIRSRPHPPLQPRSISSVRPTTSIDSAWCCFGCRAPDPHELRRRSHPVAVLDVRLGRQVRPVHHQPPRRPRTHEGAVGQQDRRRHRAASGWSHGRRTRPIGAARSSPPTPGADWSSSTKSASPAGVGWRLDWPR